jgi:hypothetical protein
MKKIIVLSAILAMGWTSCTFEKGEAPSLGCSIMSYTTDIQPIIMAKCATAGCHIAGASQGDFTVFTEFKAKADGGLVKNRVFVTKDMPPAGSPPLTEDELRKLNCWLEQGAQNN